MSDESAQAAAAARALEPGSNDRQRQERLRRIREQVAAGVYRPDAAEIAAKIVAAHLSEKNEPAAGARDKRKPTP
jgi:anti-sigma28 factor (negative regulator of flagellin synthesis)